MALSKSAYDTLLNIGRSTRNDDEAIPSGSDDVILKPSPFCYETSDTSKELRGWTLDIPHYCGASSIPLTNKIFHGVSIALCDISENEILKMIQDDDETNAKLACAIESIMNDHSNESVDRRASWLRCKPSPFTGYPSSLQQALKEKDGVITFQQYDNGSTPSNPIIDSEEWLPELSPDGFVGFFHHWVSTGHGNRLVLYCVCQSYLPKACKEFVGLVNKVSDVCTAGSVCLSEEMQWLKNACSRNRAKIIAKVCSDLNIKVPVVKDYHCPSNKTYVAVITAETLHHDMIMFEKNVRVFNYCAETRLSFNGTLCVMAPWEGIWIFQGMNTLHEYTKKTISGVSDFGKPYGNAVLCTSSPKVLSVHISANASLSFSKGDPTKCKGLCLWKQSKCESLSYKNTSNKDDICDNYTLSLEGVDACVLLAYQKYLSKRKGYLLDSTMCTDDALDEYFLTFDERILSKMASMGWARTQGIIKLIPLCCGYYEHWISRQKM